MYKRILVAIEHSNADRTILDHVAKLADMTGATLLLVHVADGWAARNFDQLQAQGIRGDEGRPRVPRAGQGGAGATGGRKVEAQLAMGDPRTSSRRSPTAGRWTSSRCPRTGTATSRTSCTGRRWIACGTSSTCRCCC